MTLSHESPPAEPEGYPDSTPRAIVSLMLFIHLCCLFVALTSNYYLSPLQIALLNSPIGMYVQPFKLKPTAPYHITDSSELSTDHYLEVEVMEGPQKGEILRLPDGEVGASPSGRRAEVFARTIGATTYMGADPNTARLVKAVGSRVLNEGGNEAVVVRVIRVQPQQRVLDRTNPATPADPTAPEYLATAYEARVWRDSLDQIQMLKIEEKKVVAPVE